MGAALTLRNDRLTLRVSRGGGAIVDGYTADGRPFLRPCAPGSDVFDIRQAACFPLVPIGNRVAGNAFDLGGKHYTLQPNTDEPLYIHGDGWLGEWTPVGDVDSPGGLSLSFARVASPASPYAYRAVQRIALDGTTLRLGLSVENTGIEPLPFGLGFHPFFPRTPRMTLRAPALAWWTESADHLPGARGLPPQDLDFAEPRQLPRRWLNNCFEGWNGLAQIDWPESGLAVTIAADDAFSRYMLYAPDDDSFFCLEPMSHSLNALATVETDPMGLRILAPGGALSAGFSITVFERSNADD